MTVMSDDIVAFCEAHNALRNIILLIWNNYINFNYYLLILKNTEGLELQNTRWGAKMEFVY